VNTATAGGRSAAGRRLCAHRGSEGPTAGAHLAGAVQVLTGRELEAGTDLIGVQLVGDAGVAVLVGPAVRLPAAGHDHPIALRNDSVTCSAWSRQTTTGTNEVGPSRQPRSSWILGVTASRKFATGVPFGV
jgi:hypothetical protein